MKKILIKIHFSVFYLLIVASLFQPSSVLAAEPIQPWLNTTSLPTPIASHIVQPYNGKLFLVAGANTVLVPENISSNINSLDGSLQNWISSNPSPTILWHASAIKNNHVYLLGGRSASGESSDVYMGNINPSGAIENWETLTPLPVASSLGAAIVVEDKLYFAGGFGTQEIYWSQINTDGTIGTWTLAGQLPQLLTGFGLVTHNSHLIIVGGRDHFNDNMASVYKADVANNGSLGNWQQLNSLSETAYRAGVIKSGNVLFSIGGLQSNNSPSNKVYYSTINNDGTISPWTTSQYDLPQAFCCGAVAATDKYLYFTGGHDGNDYFDTVYFTKLQSATQTLNVPLFKQGLFPYNNNDPLWEGEEFDHANGGQFTCGRTMAQCGCSTTSVAMVLKYHGIEKLPDGTSLTPGTLNNWLKANNGYNRNQGIIWGAAGVLSKLAKNQNPNFNYDALEYDRKGSNKTQLTNDLQNNMPGILEVPGHFIVGTGIDGDTFTINDPAYNKTKLTAYDNTFKSLGRFVPSNTDISYITLVVDKEINISLKNSTGESMGESYLEYGIDDATDSEETASPEATLKILSFPKPSTGAYQIELNGPSSQTYQLDIYTIDTEGNNALKTYKGVIASNTNDTFSLYFDKENGNNSKMQKTVTFESTLQDIKELKALKLLNPGIAQTLEQLIKNSEKDFKKNKDRQALHSLQLAEKLLELGKKVHLVKQPAYDILKADITELKKLVAE